MSRSQFHSKELFLLRHAWLNLLDERMTTGRINQVAIFSPARKPGKYTQQQPNKGPTIAECFIRKYTQHQVVRYFATSHLSPRSIVSRLALSNRILRSMPSLSYSQVSHDTACAFNALQFYPHGGSAHSSTK